MHKQLSKRILFILILLIVLTSTYSTLATTLFDGVFSNVNITPNPLKFGSTANINYSLSESSTVTIKITSTDGNTIYRNLLTESNKSAGTFNQTWDGYDNDGNPVADGQYRIYLTATSQGELKGQVERTLTLARQPFISDVTNDIEPFNPSLNPAQQATIHFTLSSNALVTIKILKGTTIIRNISTNELKAGGTHSFIWDGKDDTGNLVADSTYTYQIDAVSPMVSTFKSTFKGSTTVEKENPIVTIQNVSPNPMKLSSNTLSISFSLSEDASVTVKILDSNNQLVQTVLRDSIRKAGNNSTSWLGTDSLDKWVPEGKYKVVISAVDNFQKPSLDVSKEFTAAYQPQCTFTINPYPFNPINEQLAINYTLSNNALVTVNILRGSTIVETLKSSEYQTTNSYKLTWDGKDLNGNLFADGTYTVQIDTVSPTVASYKSTTRVDTALETSNPQISNFSISPNPLRLGSFNLLVNYTLSENAKVTIEILDSNNVVIHRVLDGYLKNIGTNMTSWSGTDTEGKYIKEGNYTVRICAVDSFGNTSSTLTKSFTAAYQPAINVQTITGNPLNPDAGEAATINYTLSSDAYVNISILKDESLIKVIQSNQLTTAGNYNFTWNGTDSNEKIVGDGKYTYKIDAVSPIVPSFSSSFKDTITLEAKTPSITDVSIVPNPVKVGSTCTIRYTLSELANINVIIRNANGLVRQFNESTKHAGTYYFSWDTRDDLGNLILGGEYTLDIIATDYAGKMGSTSYLFNAGAVPVISNVAASPAAIDVYDGQKSEISYTVSTDSNVTINFYDSKNFLWNTVNKSVNGPDTYLWDGASSTGAFKEDTFKFTITAISKIGNYQGTSVSGTITSKNVPITGKSCTNCHINYPDPHPVNNCSGCHGGGQPINDCYSCHGGTHDTRVLNKYDCTYCHNETYSYKIPIHTNDIEGIHITETDMTNCSTCHNSSLIHEHQGNEDENGIQYTCDTCHKSTRQAVLDSIRWGQRSCSNCHSSAHGQTMTNSIPGSIPQFISAASALEWSNPIPLEYLKGESWVPSDVVNGYYILTKRRLDLSQDEVFNFYINEMKKLGWVKVTGASAPADKFELVYSKDSKKAYIRYYNTERYNTSTIISKGSRIEILYK